MEPFENLGRQFLQQYYHLFDNKATRPQVANLYHTHESILNFEGQKFVGVEAILGKHAGMAFDNIVRDITTVDVQPLSGGSQGTIISILGQLRTDSEHDKVMGFSQTFILKQFDNNFFIVNDIFRLVLHNVAA